MTKEKLQQIICKQGNTIAIQKAVIRGLRRDLKKKQCVSCERSE